MKAPRPIDAVDSVWMEELTWMEVRDAIKGGKTTALILTGGVESNGPHLATGKHNYVLKVMGEAIARKLGNALVAPIVTLEPGSPDGERVAPGSVFLSQETYRAVLSDMAMSLEGMGFTNVILMGDSGGNQARDEGSRRRAQQEIQGAPATPSTSSPSTTITRRCRSSSRRAASPSRFKIGASQGSDKLHEEFGIDALMALDDPKTIRIDSERRPTARRSTA